MNRNMLLLGALVLVLAAGATVFVLMEAPPPTGAAPQSTSQNTNTTADTTQAKETQVADKPTDAMPAIPQAKGPRTRVKIETSKGDFEILFFDDLVPKTVKNFLDLTKKGFYNGLTFHRVIPNFMVQGGDPNGDGTGGPGYTIPDEWVGLKHTGPGLVAMARTSAPNSAGSQFYVTVAATPWLDQDRNTKYCIFGQVVKGMDVVYAISKADRDPNDKPMTPIMMKSVTILGTESPGAESTGTN